MARTTQNWYPDTCACIISETVEMSDPEDARIPVLDFVGRKCAAHQGVAAPEDVYATVKGENKRKNDVLRIAQTRRGTLIEEDYDWSFSGSGTSRVLSARLRGITATQRNQIQADVDATHGAGSVAVVRA